jgi:hypothetical protein
MRAVMVPPCSMAELAPSRSQEQDASIMKPSMSMPEFSELADMQAFEENFFRHYREEHPSSPAHGEDVLGHYASHNPLRIFSLGLRRSISMPREEGAAVVALSPTKHKEQQQQYQQPLSENNQPRMVSLSDSSSGGDDKDFFIDDDTSCSSSTAHEQIPLDPYNRASHHRWYSEASLRTVILPPKANLPLRQDAPYLWMEEPQQPPSSAYKLPPSPSLEARRKRLEKVAKRTVSREAAVTCLEDFFCGPQPVAVVAPRSELVKRASSRISTLVQGETPVHSNKSNDKANNDNTKENDSILCQQGAPISPPRRRIFENPYAVPSCFDDNTLIIDDENGFKPLCASDRANSCPYPASPSSSLPRKPSLKKVSSINSIKQEASGLKPSVSFSNLSIREYNVALGDHPSCSYGPPIALGWKYQDKDQVSLDDYEDCRNPRRSMNQLVLSYNIRKYLLLKTAGYNRSDLRAAMAEVNRVKRDRQWTDMSAGSLDEVMEGVVDQVRNLFGRHPSHLDPVATQ